MIYAVLYVLVHLVCAWGAVAACRADYDGDGIGPAPWGLLLFLALIGPAGLPSAAVATWITHSRPFYHGFKFLP